VVLAYFTFVWNRVKRHQWSRLFQKQECILQSSMWIYFLLKKTISSPFFTTSKFRELHVFAVFWITSFLRLRLEEVWSPNKRCHKLCATFYVLKLLSLFASCLLSYLFLCFSLSKRNSKMNNIHDFVWLIISTERKHI
jgi:hypothetical protein